MNSQNLCSCINAANECSDKDNCRVTARLKNNRPAKTLTDEELLGAISRGWCSEKNSSKTMDSDLSVAIADEIKALLKKAGGK
jgi:hypothetical protein